MSCIVDYEIIGKNKLLCEFEFFVCKISKFQKKKSMSCSGLGTERIKLKLKLIDVVVLKESSFLT